MSFDLAAYAAETGIPEPERFVQRCERFRGKLLEVNAHTNLTRIVEQEEFAIKHAADSLSIVRIFPELGQGRFDVADLGCGAGFPSVILALAFPQLRITAIDSTGKKARFVEEAAAFLELANLHVVCGRVNELNRKREFQGKFDVVTARAVATAASLSHDADKFLRRGGRFLFYKTPGQAAEELPQLQTVSRFTWSRTAEFELPDGAGARLFLVGMQ